jgi:tRNA 2-thiouridine synthesizing protein A
VRERGLALFRFVLEIANIRAALNEAPSDQSPIWNAMNFDKELDARGLNCPLPILKAKKALTDMASGQVLRILATDPGSVKDFEAFSKQTGNALLEQSTAGTEYTFFMKKK